MCVSGLRMETKKSEIISGQSVTIWHCKVDFQQSETVASENRSSAESAAIEFSEGFVCRMFNSEDGRNSKFVRKFQYKNGTHDSEHETRVMKTFFLSASSNKFDTFDRKKTIAAAKSRNPATQAVETHILLL